MSQQYYLFLLFAFSIVSTPFLTVQAYDHFKHLYDDLMKRYDRVIRPVENATAALIVKLGLKLFQIIDIDEKNQIMTTNVWLYLEWQDHKLKWDPKKYGGIDRMYLPSEKIWLPDVVLYNNADGHYEVYIFTKAQVNHTGYVKWLPPAIYKSYCAIKVEYFPFDEQECYMKFGTWTYDGSNIDLRHMNSPMNDPDAPISFGWDLSEYSQSVEWDIMSAPATRNVRRYECCPEPFLDIYFNITLRRKTLFYTVNLIVPCVGISFLSVLVFYLPSDSGEKMTLSISILVSLTVFFLLLIDIIPPTSLVVPLIGKYLIFTMVLVNLSISVTVLVLNLNFRAPSELNMPKWIRKVFVDILPDLLWIQRPEPNEDDDFDEDNDDFDLNNYYHNLYMNDNLHSHRHNRNYLHSFNDLRERYTYKKLSNSSAKHMCSCGTIQRDSVSGKQKPFVSKTVLSSLSQLMNMYSNVVNHKVVCRHCEGKKRLKKLKNLHNSNSFQLPRFSFTTHEESISNTSTIDDLTSNVKYRPKHNKMSVQEYISMNDDVVETIRVNRHAKNLLESMNRTKHTEKHCCKYHRRSFRQKLLNDTINHPEIKKSIEGVQYIVSHLQDRDKDRKALGDWKYVGLVLDRIFLILFTSACIFGTIGIMCSAPSLYDNRENVLIQMSRSLEQNNLNNRNIMSGNSASILPTAAATPSSLSMKSTNRVSARALQSSENTTTNKQFIETRRFRRQINRRHWRRLRRTDRIISKQKV
ncbi:hypothetical protein SNEBB_004262 [Seison nebaliae]|nr:hypothetical protein SNEBB_004262 [Seison nebaliae]